MSSAIFPGTSRLDSTGVTKNQKKTTAPSQNARPMTVPKRPRSVMGQKCNRSCVFRAPVRRVGFFHHGEPRSHTEKTRRTRKSVVRHPTRDAVLKDRRLQPAVTGFG